MSQDADPTHRGLAPPPRQTLGTSETQEAGDLRSRLIRAAEEEILDVGVGAVSLRAIARRAGASHQAPGHIFGDRAGLFTAVARTGYARLAADLKAGYEGVQSTDPTARLSGIATAYVTFALTNPAVFAVLARPELCNLDDEELAESRAAPLRVLDDAVAAAIATGWGRGEDPRTLALLCWSMVHGLSSLARDGILAIDVPDATPEQLAETLSAAIVGALRPSAPAPRA